VENNHCKKRREKVQSNENPVGENGLQSDLWERPTFIGKRREKNGVFRRSYSGRVAREKKRRALYTEERGQ